MNTNEFIAAVRRAVREGAARGVISTLGKPPGRSPDAEAVQLSQWFNTLSSEDQDLVKKVACLAADQATYNFLLVLDGLLRVENGERKGRLELFHDNGLSRTLLNDPSAEELTALYKAQRE